jgi:hypothetical protein
MDENLSVKQVGQCSALGTLILIEEKHIQIEQ